MKKIATIAITSTIALTLTMGGWVKAQTHDGLYVYRSGVAQPDTLALSEVTSISHTRTDLSGREQKDYVVMTVRLSNNEVRRYRLSELDSVVMQRDGDRFRLTRFVGSMSSKGAATRRTLRRTSLQGDDLKAATADVEFFWETDDHIWLADGRQSLDTLMERSQAETAEFFFGGATLTDAEVVVYYSGTNGSSYNTVRVAANQTQEQPDDTKHIGVAGDCGTAVATKSQDGKTYNFMLDHKASYLCFLPYIANDLERTVLRKIVVRSDSAIAGVFTLSPDGILPHEDTTHTVTLTTGDFILPRAAQPATSAYMVIAPQNGATRLTCEFTVYDTELQSTGTYSKIVDLDRVEPNMLYVVKANLNNYVVDLGLPVRFLNHNMGAYFPEDYGGYYAWGELSDKGSYNGNNTAQYALYKRYVGDDIRLTDYDVAHVRLGQNFSMPNVAEMRMLLDSCAVSVVAVNGVKGMKFTRKGNNLFLPYAGYRNGLSFEKKGSIGYYYTSTRSGSKEDYVWQFYKEDNKVVNVALTSGPYIGKSIRPVISSGMTMTDGTLLQVTTDSVQWAPGLPNARLFATINGYDRATTAAKATVEAGFVVGDTPDITLADDTRQPVVIVADGQYQKEVPAANNHEYFYRAYVKTADSVYYGKPLRFGRRLADLRLPSGNLWSGINLGTHSPDRDGNYFAWGETDTKKSYTEENWKWYGQQTYFFPDGLNNIQATRHDVAAQQWGEVWMLPDDADLKELEKCCSFTQSTFNGMPGVIVKNKTVPGADSLFLPSSGFLYSSTFNNYTSYGRYLSSQMKREDNRNEYNFFTNSNNGKVDSSLSIYYGLTVRPVYKRNATAANGQPLFVRTLPARRTYDGSTETDTLRATIRGLDIAGSGNTYGIVWWKEGSSSANYQPLTAGVDGHLTYALTGQEAGATYCYAAYVDNGDNNFYGDTLSVTTVDLVDLGLPSGVKWATANVGLEADGDFYRWGASATYLGSVEQQSSCQTDLSVEKGNDMASNLWGPNYRMPSKTDLDDLMDENYCTRQWTTRYGVSGYLFTSKVAGYEGNSIFLPARGYYYNTGYSAYDGCHQGWNTEGRYWTSTIDGSDKAYYLQLKAASQQVSSVTRADGFCVRPVQDQAVHAMTTGCDWTVFETTNDTPSGYKIAATLSGGASIPASVDPATVSYGFIVGTIDQVDTATPSATNEVQASNRNASGRYSVSYPFDGSARFFRAYAKVGGTYSLGAVKAITAADLLDVEFLADGSAMNGTFTNLTSVNHGSVTTSYNSTYKRYECDLTANTHHGTPTKFYQFFFGNNSGFMGKLTDGHSVEALLRIPATPPNDNSADAFSNYQNGGSGISIRKKNLCGYFHIGGSYRTVDSGVTPEVNRYYHVVASWNKATGAFDIYVDGELKSTLTGMTGDYKQPDDGHRYYVVGGNPNSSNAADAFSGYVTFARIYDTPLTAGQVKTLYNALTK